MAEAVFTHIVKERNLNISVDSCGTAGYHVGESPDRRSVAECQRNGVSVSHKARQLRASDFQEFDYILVMDHHNLRDVQSKKPKQSTTHILLFGTFDPQGREVIEDPYYGGPEGFRINYEQCVRASHGFLKHLGHDSQ
jgi:low molecular weight phosphotyrosine protein phosphatase